MVMKSKGLFWSLIAAGRLSGGSLFLLGRKRKAVDSPQFGNVLQKLSPSSEEEKGNDRVVTSSLVNFLPSTSVP